MRLTSLNARLAKLEAELRPAASSRLDDAELAKLVRDRLRYWPDSPNTRRIAEIIENVRRRVEGV
ncbi:MAG: hypothetical protein KGK07_17695 [Chloroflexota bacterium]|nr:hypothetical protein [Chloroflexota bacterium]